MDNVEVNEEEKKKEKKKDDSPDVVGFTKAVMFHLIVFVFVCVAVVGVFFQFMCKLAHANVLPDRADLAPYTPTQRVGSGTSIPIHVVKEKGLWGKAYAVQAVFSASSLATATMDNSVLAQLRKASAEPNCGNPLVNGTLYYAKVIESLSVFSYSMISMLCYAAAAMAPEWLVQTSFGLGGGFFVFALWGINGLASLYYHVVHAPQLFRVAASDDKKAGWQPEDQISYLRPFKAAAAVAYAFLAAFTAFLLPPFVTASTLITPFFATFTTEHTTTIHGWSTFFLDELKYKRTLLMVLSSLVVFSDANTYLGSDIAAALVLVAGITAYFTPLFRQTVDQQDGFKALPNNYLVVRNKINS